MITEEYFFSGECLLTVSSVLFPLSNEKTKIRSKGFCTFNISFTKDQNYIIEIKKQIRNISTENESLFNHQSKW